MATQNWRVDDDETIVNGINAVGIVCEDSGIIAEVYKEGDWEANADLIAAAPEMLDALLAASCGCNPLHPCARGCFMRKVEKVLKRLAK